MGKDAKKVPRTKADDIADVKRELRNERGRACNFTAGRRGRDCEARMRASKRVVS
jgi:hypothetical protein